MGILLKIFVMDSHALPEPELLRMVEFTRYLDQGIQADAHKITGVAESHVAFDQSWLTGDCRRAMLSYHSGERGRARRQSCRQGQRRFRGGDSRRP